MSGIYSIQVRFIDFQFYEYDAIFLRSNDFYCRDDFSPKFVALFTLLLFLKSFHWLAEDRVDFMERSPSISALFHIRVISLAALLAIIDINFILHAYQSTLSKGASVQLVFGFEYAILVIIIANTLVKYVLHSIDLYRYDYDNTSHSYEIIYSWH